MPLTGGTFTGPGLNGKLLSGASADWQLVLPDGTSFGDIRYTLQTDGRDLLYVQSRSVRHGSAEVLHASGAVRASMPASTPSAPRPKSRPPPPQLDWLNKGVFISVGARQTTGVIYETYLVE